MRMDGQKPQGAGALHIWILFHGIGKHGNVFSAHPFGVLYQLNKALLYHGYQSAIISLKILLMILSLTNRTCVASIAA